jgi:uncharacterized protein YybS (DUF2232 family)
VSSAIPPHPRVLKEILIGTSLCALIFGITFALPLLGVFALLLLPLPVLFFRLKLGKNSGAAIVALSFTVLMIMTRGLAFDILYFGSLLMTGLFLGECIERQFSIQKTMTLTTLVVAGAALAAFGLYSATQGKSMGGLVAQYLDQYLSLTQELYAEMGMDKDQIQVLNQAFVMVLPGMFLVSYLATLWLNILIIRTLLRRKGIALRSMTQLNCYRSPDHLVWVVILLGLALMLPSQTAKVVSINCLIVLMLVYFFQGIAVVSFFFTKKNTPMFLRVVCYSLIAVQIYFMIMVIGVGFFDNWLNFRKLDTTT